MEQFILQLGMMSLQASIVICVVLLVRLLFVQMQVPKRYMCILWILPYLCMICPWKIESSFGFWRMPEQVQVEQVQEVFEELSFGNGQILEEQQVVKAEVDTKENLEVLPVNTQAVRVPNKEENGIENTSVSNTYTVSLILNILCCIWFTGVIGLLVYSIVSYLKLRQKLICSICMSENIYIADDIHVPFVLGILKPRIYLPSDLPQENLEYVLAHEKTHIRRWDPLKKILALGISALHWFNPLSWVAFHFMERDMEMACDEETIQILGLEHKKDYAEALLVLSSGKKLFLGVPLAFDEGNVKSRICNILKYKKAWRVATGAAVVLIAVLAVCFMSRSTEENESESRRLSEYLIDLTGDKVDEQIVFEVDATETTGMTDAEVLEQVWTGNLSLFVRILEGVGSNTSEGNSTGKGDNNTEAIYGDVLWEASYSGKYAENGNLAICEYLSKPSMLVKYNNEVTDGTGRFWYEVLSFEKGEASVIASNEAVYNVVDMQELEGQKLSAEYLAMAEQVLLVEEELDNYLDIPGISRSLLKVVREPECCYLYQENSTQESLDRDSQNAFEVFYVQADGTGAEWKMEDFFYPKNPEGTTVLPEDARERVLAGEVLCLDVREKNDTAGNLDLDGDGQVERIYLEAIDGYMREDELYSGYRLRVNNAYYEVEYADTVRAQVMLYSPDGETILMAVFDGGPSGDPLTTFYRYDAENEQVLWTGEMPCDLKDAAIEDGVIKSSFRVHMIETQGAMGYWIWDGEQVVLREDDVYEILPYSERYGENGEIYEDGYMKLKEALTVYAEKSEESKAFIMEPQMVLCTSSDLKEWIYLVAKDGTEGWLRVVDMHIPSAENKETREVFDGLGFAG